MSTRAGCAGAPSRCACSTFSEAVVWQTRSKAALPYQKVWRGARAVRGARCRARCAVRPAQAETESWLYDDNLLNYSTITNRRDPALFSTDYPRPAHW